MGGLLAIAPACVLFDLDGTLLDTAPDMGRALNRLLQEQGKPVLPQAKIRPVVSHGTRGLLELGFGLDTGHARYEALRQRYLAIYASSLARDTVLFPGMESVLTALEQRALPWGVVTNKPGRLTKALLGQLALDGRAACIVSGDTTANSKPHPEPLLHACQQLGLAPEVCLYVGDAERDIQAGRAAGMATLAARYGYIHAWENPAVWNANGVIDTPEELFVWLGWMQDRRHA